MTRHDQPLDVIRDWAGVGTSFQFHLHQFRELFASWGCSAGIVKIIFLFFRKKFYFFFSVAGASRTSAQSLSDDPPHLCQDLREV